MAKGCVYYQIETDDGSGWKRDGKPFRDTSTGANRRFDEYAGRAATFLSVRLGEVRVLAQKNGVRS